MRVCECFWCITRPLCFVSGIFGITPFNIRCRYDRNQPTNQNLKCSPFLVHYSVLSTLTSLLFATLHAYSIFGESLMDVTTVTNIGIALLQYISGVTSLYLLSNYKDMHSIITYMDAIMDDMYMTNLEQELATSLYWKSILHVFFSIFPASIAIMHAIASSSMQLTSLAISAIALSAQALFLRFIIAAHVIFLDLCCLTIMQRLLSRSALNTVYDIDQRRLLRHLLMLVNIIHSVHCSFKRMEKFCSNPIFYYILGMSITMGLFMYAVILKTMYKSFGITDSSLLAFTILLYFSILTSYSSLIGVEALNVVSCFQLYNVTFRISDIGVHWHYLF